MVFVRLKAPGQYLHLWYERVSGELLRVFQYQVNFALKLALELNMFWSTRFVFILFKDSWMKILIMLFQTCMIDLKKTF